VCMCLCLCFHCQLCYESLSLKNTTLRFSSNSFFSMRSLQFSIEFNLFLFILAAELRADTLPLEWFFFCFSYLPSRVSHFCLALDSDLNPPTYSLLHSWGHRCILPPYLLRWGFANFSSNLCLSNSWDYRCKPLLLA
jgi:hypothetical protein